MKQITQCLLHANRILTIFENRNILASPLVAQSKKKEKKKKEKEKRLRSLKANIGASIEVGEVV